MDQTRRLEMLVRQGLMPAQNLPVLKRAIARVQMGSQLLPNEREVIKTFMDELMFIVFGDDTVFNRAKQHTQQNKYQTEEQIVSQLDEKMVDGVEVVDGEEERMKDEKKATKLGRKPKVEKLKMLAKSLRKEKERSGVDEEILKMNEDYKAKFDAALKKYGVSSIRDLSADKKKEFFNYVDSIHAAKNEETEQKATKKDGSLKPVKLKGFGPDHAKGNMSNPAARAALMRKEEVEQVDEEKLLEYITSKQIKMAKGIANDPRHKGGDYTGAAKKMEKIKKGLSNHPASQKALRQANESLEDIDASDLMENPLVALAARTLATKGAARFGANKLTQKVAGSAASAATNKFMSKNTNEEVGAEEVVDAVNEAMTAAERAARSDYSRDDKKGLAKTKKDKPDLKHDEKSDKGPEHIVPQLRKAITVGKPVTFHDGKSHTVNKAHAHKWLNKYMNSKPAEKEAMQNHSQKSHKHFLDHTK